jgi:activator of Hsp90 ATPase-like protein
VKIIVQINPLHCPDRAPRPADMDSNFGLQLIINLFTKTFNKMEKQNINCIITADITAKQALEKISHVSEWWAANIEGKTENTGDVFKVIFGTTWVNFKVTEVVPDEKVVWKVTDCFLPWLNDKTEWTGSEIIWEISPAEDGVQIHFTHTLAPQAECFNQCEKAWTGYIKDSLFTYIAEGHGMPNKF